MTSLPPAAPVLRLQANPIGRDLIVGDIHGHFTKLHAALKAVGFDPARDRLISVGDLVDRGPESPDALRWLRQPWFYAVKGNHEDMLCMHHAGRYPAVFLCQNGGAWAVAMIPEERLPYADAFGDLPLAITLETAAGPVGIVHADCPRPSWGEFTAALEAGEDAPPPLPGMVMPGSVAEAAMWSRSRIECAATGFGPGNVAGVRAVVVGHTPSREVRRLGNVIHIDTYGWKADGRFTLLDAATLEPVTGTA